MFHSTLFSSNLAKFGGKVWENVICKDPTIGYDFFVVLGLLNKIPKYLELIFSRKKIIAILSRGATAKSEMFKKHPYWGKMTTRGNLAPLVLIVTLGCSHAYVVRITNTKILLEIMI